MGVCIETHLVVEIVENGYSVKVVPVVVVFGVFDFLAAEVLHAFDEVGLVHVIQVVFDLFVEFHFFL